MVSPVLADDEGSLSAADFQVSVVSGGGTGVPPRSGSPDASLMGLLGLLTSFHQVADTCGHLITKRPLSWQMYATRAQHMRSTVVS